MVCTSQAPSKDMAPWHAYWKTGITNSFGPAFGMIALKNITYSAQVDHALLGWFLLCACKGTFFYCPVLDT